MAVRPVLLGPPATSMLVMAPYCCLTLWGLLPSTCAPFVFGFPLFSIVSTTPMEVLFSMIDPPLPRACSDKEIR